MNAQKHVWDATLQHDLDAAKAQLSEDRCTDPHDVQGRWRDAYEQAVIAAYLRADMRAMWDDDRDAPR
jgi:hypothetical protein